MTTPKISVYSLSDLKNTTDDALPNYLTSLKFTQSHYYADVRLGLGYSAVTIAAVTFLADYKLGWDATKAATLWAVIAYFVINGALTAWIWRVEKGKVFVGERGKSSISIVSHTKKYDPTYRLNVTVSAPQRSSEKILEISSPFTRWFDSDGYFVAKPFQQWLASEIDIVGEADPKNAKAAKEIQDGYVELKDDVQVVGGKIEEKKTATGNETPNKKARERSRKSKGIN